MRHDAMDDDEIPEEQLDGTWRVPNHRRDRGMDPAVKRMGLIALAVGGVAVLGVAGWSMTGHRNTVVPVIQADSRPIRIKPDNPGGLQVAGGDEFSSDSSPETSKMAPGSEKPEPNALRMRQQDAPKPAQAAIEPTPAAPVVAAVPDKPVVVAKAPAPAPATAPAKGTLVQLAALGSEEAARAEWANLNKRIPDLLGGHQPSFSKTERDGKVFWRLRTGGFTDMAQATSFCERARAKGASCSIASF
jgi:hypothetical protein